MLQINQLSVHYTSGKQTIPALQKLSLTLQEKRLYTLIGPSGCGKSTLLKTLCGLIPPTEGSITQNGQAFRPQDHRIGFVPQNYSLFPWQTLEANILLGCRIRQKAHDPELLDALLSALKLRPLLKRYPHELSGGQQQRAAIARALLLQPEILFMDEPFSALDALTREELQKLFLTLWQAHPTMTLFVTHSIEEATYLGQEILVLTPPPQQTLETVKNPGFLHDPTHINPELQLFQQQLHQKLREVQA